MSSTQALEPQVLPEVGCETLNFGEILNAI
jgi:hypothetical protein